MPRQSSFRRIYRYQPYARPYATYGKVVQRSPSVMKKEVAKIAKRVVMRNQETKNLQIGRDDQALFYVTDYWYELCQNVVVGNNEGQRISDKIQDVYADLSFHYSHRNVSHDGSSLRILIIKSNQEMANLASAWQPGAFGTAFPFLFSAQAGESSAIVNKHDYTVLLDTNLRSWRNIAATPTGVPGILRKRVKLGNWTYETQTGAGGIHYQKFRNIYLIVTCSEMGTTPIQICGDLAFSGFLYFKDA